MAARQLLETTTEFFDFYLFFLKVLTIYIFYLASVAEIHRLLIKTICPFEVLPFSSFLCNSRKLKRNNVTCKFTFLPAQIPQELTQLCYIHDVSIIKCIICMICSPVIPKFPYKFIQPWQLCCPVRYCSQEVFPDVMKFQYMFFICRIHLYKINI